MRRECAVSPSGIREVDGKPRILPHPKSIEVWDADRQPLRHRVHRCTRPTPEDPGLMEYGDVQTFFHEFGHLMHAILGGQQPWAGISGISMESDFVEAPSQMLEEWIQSPRVLASFARDYQSGKPIPADLVLRMKRAQSIGALQCWMAAEFDAEAR
jgi:Zn-dependent oligopeptidase